MKLQSKTFSILTLLVLQSSVQTFAATAFAADDAENSALVEMIRHSNIVNPDFKLQAAVSVEEALITTQRKPKSTDADCKIQAVLIAKTVFDSVPEGVQRVKILLLDYEANECSSLTVKRAEVKLFGSGGLSQKDLLASLELVKSSSAGGSNTLATPAVVAGPGETSRLLLLGRIEKLKSKGANVSGFMTFFAQIEAAAKAGDASSVQTKSDYLADKLSDQETAIKQIKAAASAPKSISGGTNAEASVADIARRFSAGTLNGTENATFGLAMKQMQISNRLDRMNGKGANIDKAILQCQQAHNLLNKGDLPQAQSLLEQLDREYPQ